MPDEKRLRGRLEAPFRQRWLPQRAQRSWGLDRKIGELDEGTVRLPGEAFSPSAAVSTIGGRRPRLAESEKIARIHGTPTCAGYERSVSRRLTPSLLACEPAYPRHRIGSARGARGNGTRTGREAGTRLASLLVVGLANGPSAWPTLAPRGVYGLEEERSVGHRLENHLPL